MILVLLLQGHALLLFSMSISTIFSDPRLAVQLGSLLLFLPLTLFIGIFNIDASNPWRLYFGYIFPQFPTTILVAKLTNIDVNINTGVAWVALIANLPLQFALYWWLD